ncbi:AbrB family transcriptional regulator [Stutzerimonas chloritidismutans]|uniref:AbrB family transcriptional regulator n=1 Tax=Stutzerimonas chloritidismutans TaxID=203192 RepID=UPI003F1755A8
MTARSSGLHQWWATPLVGTLGALLASAAHWPLPWIIGSLLAVTVVRCIGWRVQEVPHGRMSGQLIIATAIGLHFTQTIFAEVSAHFVLIVSAAVLTFLLAVAGIALIRRLGMDLGTAYFAFMPANFAEMVRLAEDNGADVSRVAAAHSVRLTVIVLCVPALAFWLGGVEPMTNHVRPDIDWRWLTPMLAGGVLVAWLGKRIGLPNPWMFGPIGLCAALTASFDLQLALPEALSHYGQLMIGCALGVHFDRNFFHSAPAFLLRALLFTLAMIGSTAALAWVVARLVTLPAPTLSLGMMPGSSTEMYLTAEALHLGVGLVTAMQITRLVVVMLAAEPLYRRWSGRRERQEAK